MKLCGSTSTLNLMLPGIEIKPIQLRTMFWRLIFLLDLTKNLILYLPLTKFKGAGAGPSTEISLYFGDFSNKLNENSFNNFSDFEDNIIAIRREKGGIKADFL